MTPKDMLDALEKWLEHQRRNKLNDFNQSRFQDLTAAKLRLIKTVAQHTHPTMTDLATTLQLSKGTVTAEITSLEKKHYLQRISDPQDRRCHYVMLTSKGKRAYQAHLDYQKQITASLLDDLTHLLNQNETGEML